MDAKEWHMHVRPPRKIDSCSRRHNNGSKLESSADLLFLPRICYSCSDLPRFVIPAQICYSCTDLLRFVIPGKICCSHSQLVSSGFNTKVAACPDQRQQNHLHNYWNFSTFSVLFEIPLPAFKESNIHPSWVSTRRSSAKQRGSIWWHCVVSLLWLGGGTGIQCIGGR